MESKLRLSKQQFTIVKSRQRKVGQVDPRHESLSNTLHGDEKLTSTFEDRHS